MKERRDTSAPIKREAWSILSLAEALDCSAKTIRRAIDAGHLDTFKIGSAVRITDESKCRWVASLRGETEPTRAERDAEMNEISAALSDSINKKFSGPPS